MVKANWKALNIEDEPFFVLQECLSGRWFWQLSIGSNRDIVGRWFASEVLALADAYSYGIVTTP